MKNLTQELAQATSFFRSPNSLFASGQTSTNFLTKKQVGNEFLFRYLISSNHKKQWVQATQIAIDLDLCERVLYQENEFLLKEVRGYWALLESPKDGRRDWAPFSELRPSPEDLGMALSLIPTSLRAGPSWSSDLRATVPSKTRLRILEVKDSWLKVLYSPAGKVSTPDQVGFVDLNNVLMKADFAAQIMDEKGQWQKVKFREGYLLQLENERSIALTKVKHWKTDHDLAIVIESDETKKLLLRQTAQILKTEAEVWGISNLKAHGKVFWKQPQALDFQQPELNLRKEDLLKREVFSVSWNQKQPKIGLVSSHGIYSTQDGGETWTFLPQFKNENHPVSISPEGVWFIGTLRSKDLGKTFTNYLRIELLANLIQSQTQRPPRILKIAQIEFKKSQMEILVDTGGKRLRLGTKSHQELITEWDLLN